ncbi:hypothetical protein ACQKMD_06000 [Viridibacillus sp. NPDC096237]|uniref:hypothetical protein n=1 Tax=Viridibacillus sp. NPDC096237 TaxID=3390721 RepID=UPI003D0522D6
MFGPIVTLKKSGYPITPTSNNRSHLQFNADIGKNVWFDAGVIVMPGVTIIDNSVNGAGSIVTKDIPENVME